MTGLAEEHMGAQGQSQLIGAAMRTPPRHGAGAAARVVVLGFDSADPDLILGWARDGTLPNFGRLLGESAWGRVENPRGMVAGSVWQSFHTGVWPGRHGQYEGTKHFDSQTYEDGVYFERAELPRETLWEILSRRGHRVAVLDAPFVFLAAGLNGLHIHEWGSHERRGSRTGSVEFRAWPEDLRDDVLARYGDDPLGMHEVQCDAFKPRNLRELVPFRDALIRRVEIKTRMTVDVLGREPWSFVESNFFAAHCVGHQCWHYHDPAHPRYDPAVAHAVGDPVRDVYVALDRALGRVREAVDHESTLIVYCSHGMGPNYTATGGLLDKILLAFEGIESPQRMEHAIGMARRVWRRAPGPLRKLLVPLRARDIEARFQKRIQPAKADRRCFEVQVDGATGGVRINLKGRESRGRVEPSEYETLCRSLTRDLLEVVNAETGEPLVAKVLRPAEIYAGPFVGRMPDLLVEWNRRRPIVRAASFKVGSVRHPNPSERSGDHRPSGLFAAFGPNARRGKLDGPVAVVDFAPSIAALLGVDEVDFDGSPIEALALQRAGGNG